MRRAACVLPALALSALAWALAAPAFAQTDGQPADGQLGFQPPASPVMEQIHWFHDNYLLWILTAITLFVTALLLIVVFRFNRRANPKPAAFAHNTLLEVIWTAIPVLILVAIAVPSFRLLFYADQVPEEVDLTVKATGYQWYWGYEYPDQEIPEYFSTMLQDEDLGTDYFGNKQPRLLATDNDLVVPVGKTVRVIVTAGDVIHNFAMPSMGLKVDAIPGRLNEAWFKATRVGMFYGQCSELCGVGHAYMPISIRVVEQDEFERWVRSKTQQAAGAPAGGGKVRVAGADAVNRDQ
ncbi:MAG: cytochrome c oxidase subunit II [bacterium]